MKIPVLTTLLASLGLFAFGNAVAQVIVSNTQIDNDHYLFGIKYPTSGGTVESYFGESFVSHDNIQVFGSSAIWYAAATLNATSASFILGWDFSQTDYRISAADITNSFYLPGTNNNKYTIAIDYSTDLSTWSSLALLYDNNSTSSAVDKTETLQTGTISLASTFYYRVTITATSGVLTTADTRWTQWGRKELTTSGLTGSQAFIVDFTLAQVPEPSISALLMAGMALCGIIVLRRFQDR